MYVEVFELFKGTQQLWFRVYSIDGKVDMSEAPKKLQENWTKYGIPYKGKPVKPSDGEVFLTAIASDYNGSMVRSNNVRDDDEETIRG